MHFGDIRRMNFKGFRFCSIKPFRTPKFLHYQRNFAILKLFRFLKNKFVDAWVQLLRCTPSVTAYKKIFQEHIYIYFRKYILFRG